ncbi:porin family protein [Tenacibaculum sp. UWU-22]|uniref:porin family protein n=1 Tax=Tenacibaculum sp. UWU-22 TaxID=3234187 RepID=UPI0034DB58A9
MKNILLLCLILSANFAFSQKDSLQLGDHYLEDQLYLNITYNVLRNQPSDINNRSFPYGFSMGFIKDIPLNKGGNTALGIGVGYRYDLFNHNVKIVDNNGNTTFQVDNDLSKPNTLKLHEIVFPIQFRWRTSTAQNYSFWRIYTGVKISYNINNKFQEVATNTVYTNVLQYQKLQTGLTMSLGYDIFNFYVYYGLTPIFKKSTETTSVLSKKMMHFGLIFYIL